jgi:hypothetical protein
MNSIFLKTRVISLILIVLFTFVLFINKCVICKQDEIYEFNTDIAETSDIILNRLEKINADGLAVNDFKSGDLRFIAVHAQMPNTPGVKSADRNKYGYKIIAKTTDFITSESVNTLKKSLFICGKI